MLASPKSTRERHDETSPFNEFSPPRTAYDNNLCIYASQAAIRNTNPPSWPSDPPLPLSGRPKQECRDYARNEAHFLQHVDKPVLRATDAFTVLPWPQPEEIETEAYPYREEREDEGVLASPGTKREVLAAQTGLEDEKVQVYLRRRRREEGCGVAENGQARGFERRQTVIGVVGRVSEYRCRVWWGVSSGARGDLVEARVRRECALDPLVQGR